MARISREGCELNMTPMIDCVFQLIIFFIVTLNMEQAFNPDIQLAPSPHGPPIEGRRDPTTLIIEVNRRGWISLNGAQCSKAELQGLLQRRYNRYGEFPVFIRADKKTRHDDVRAIMDICTGVGLWRINFVAIKDKRT